MKKRCIFSILMYLILVFPLKAYGDHSHGFACLGYCHSLRSGEVIPGSRAIVSDASLVDFQMCRKCHGDSQVCANKKYYGCTKKHTPYENLPFTIVDEGYDPTWPEQGNARIYIVDIGDKRTIGTIIFEFSVFTTSYGKLVDKIDDWDHVCPSIGCCYYPELIEHWGTPVTNWWVKGEYKNLNDPSICGEFTKEHLTCWMHREQLIWDFSNLQLPIGTYEIRLTPYFYDLEGISFAVQVDIPLVYPSVVSYTPKGDVPAPIDTDIVIKFNKSMDKATTQSAFSINPSVTGNFIWSNNDKTLTFTFAPIKVLSANQQYTVIINSSAEDTWLNKLDNNDNGIGGEPTDTYTYNFITEDPDIIINGWITNCLTCFKLTDQSLEKLKIENIPEVIIDNLKILKYRLYNEEKNFVEALETIIGKGETEAYKTYKSKILNAAKCNCPIEGALIELNSIDQYSDPNGYFMVTTQA